MLAGEIKAAVKSEAAPHTEPIPGEMHRLVGPLISFFVLNFERKCWKVGLSFEKYLMENEHDVVAIFISRRF